ncbi:hypothetical protein [Streptomyces sp. CNQ-509]|uniref:hypothetical protein n=1 Tax=Streptomyces sp. CNQ-509 TaxID=444103 RepID=UPI0020A64014|nr:hypothetical protein [Streptomyces sp. CNQ-509]
MWDQLQPATPAGESSPGPAPGDAVGPGVRAEVLGEDWKSSADRAWTTTGDATGFHLLVADVRHGCAWRTAATPAEPGFETDRWIGNACVTGSGKWAVVVYAPRTFTNDPLLMSRGAFTAVVNLEPCLGRGAPAARPGESAVLQPRLRDGRQGGAGPVGRRP